ncbi:hypothetical protein H5V44_10130 [Halobellus sp. MBLA0160]|uniref:Uncharacterized protein n=1 Tax=Halobellus ruber TaxID=2761102 RepID=A0A7J9SIS8_9EURY|nr:hypothetical protein [Halobellus ruber]
MNRPKCITTRGTTTGGTPATVDTGAFTSLSADRSVGARVAAIPVTPSNGPDGECATTAGDGIITPNDTGTDEGGDGLDTATVCEFDDIRCYNRPLSDDEVTKLFNIRQG